jgi:hypothetical protein
LAPAERRTVEPPAERRTAKRLPSAGLRSCLPSDREAPSERRAPDCEAPSERRTAKLPSERRQRSNETLYSNVGVSIPGGMSWLPSAASGS